MRSLKALLWVIPILSLSLWAGLTAINAQTPKTKTLAPQDRLIVQNSQTKLIEGRNIFRYDTFGDEDFWGGQLKLHQTVAKLTPKQALGLGLKVDMDALPANLVASAKAGKVNMNDPATTLALLKLNAVVGVRGFFDSRGNLSSIGITCAICHSRVDDAFAPGIGHRLDGWPNQDLNVGAIIASAPDLSPITNLLGVDRATALKVLNSWGPGKFDAQLILDGKGFRPDGKPAATLIPPAFGLAGVNQHAWTGSWGTVTYWNAFVGNLEMHGKGRFYDPRLNNPSQYPIAVKAHLYDVRSAPDLLTNKLPALHTYQLAIPAPTPPKGSFNAAAADRGERLFMGKAGCVRCHQPPTYTEPGWNLHLPSEIGIDSFQADRAPDHRYRTQPLSGLWTHQKRGFYHDGRFPTLMDVVNHYDSFFRLGLTPSEKTDLVEYLKSLPRPSSPTAAR
ncbi:MAG: hypothetical protein ABFD64_12565 [Armatimonadota bacterium]